MFALCTNGKFRSVELFYYENAGAVMKMGAEAIFIVRNAAGRFQWRLREEWGDAPTARPEEGKSSECADGAAENRSRSSPDGDAGPSEKKNKKYVVV